MIFFVFRKFLLSSKGIQKRSKMGHRLKKVFTYGHDYLQAISLKMHEPCNCEWEIQLTSCD